MNARRKKTLLLLAVGACLLPALGLTVLHLVRLGTQPKTGSFIVLPPEEPGTAYLFALEPAAALICQELRSVGRTEVTAQQLALDEVPEFAQAERRLQTATVSSLRLDAVLAAMLRCSRGMAAELVAAGRVEINHLPVSSAHAPVYESDVFTVRGKGRFRLTALPGKSKKDRQIIEFFQY